MTTQPTNREPGVSVPEHKVRLARALVASSRRRGKRESDRIEEIAKIKLPSD
jgi:hypothetical protein